VTVRVRLLPSESVSLGALGIPSVDERLDRQSVVVAADHLFGGMPETGPCQRRLALALPAVAGMGARTFCPDVVPALSLLSKMINQRSKLRPSGHKQGFPM
jgi:hypothetical protein